MRSAELINETVKKVKGKWALVSKTTGHPLQYYHGSGYPSKEWISKVERRVHSFSEDKTENPVATLADNYIAKINEKIPGPIDRDDPATVKELNAINELLHKTDDPNVISKLSNLIKWGKNHSAVQGGVVTAIAAILTGGLLSSASRMGLSPAQTNMLLQAVLNTVIPTIIARINNKSWTDTIKYTLASAVIGTGVAALSEGLRIDVPNEEWLQSKIDYAKSKGRNAWGVPHFGSCTAYVSPNPQVSVVRLELLKGMRREQDNVRRKDLEWLMATMEKTGKLPLTDHGEEYTPFVMVAYNGEAWVNEGNHRIMAAYRLGWKTLPVELRYFDGGERVEDGIMYPGKIGLK